MSDLESLPIRENSADVPATSPVAPCCQWRSMLQVPLLLCAAAGLGFSGQQLWQNEGDIVSLLAGSSSSKACSSFGASGCCPSMASVAASGCCSELLMCGALMNTASDEPAEAVSALTPDNVAPRREPERLERL